jgi:hypothetical protein
MTRALEDVRFGGGLTFQRVCFVYGSNEIPESNYPASVCWRWWRNQRRETGGLKMKKTDSLYEEAQIFMAGIRLFRHREKRLPSLAELAEFARVSVEAAHHMCSRLEKIGAVERILGAFDDRICLKEPLEAEALRQVVDPPHIDEEVRKWKEHRDSSIQEVEKRFSPEFGKAEREELYSQIEEKIRKGGKPDRKSPLDDLFKKDP